MFFSTKNLFCYTLPMFTAQYYYTPPRLGRQEDFCPVVPDELVPYFEIAERVARYVYTENQVNFIFQDNVAVHTKRLVNYVRNLELPDFLDKVVIERMLWLHDLPEAVANEHRGSDYVTHEKTADKTFEKLQDWEESRIAREMFSLRDFRLYSAMENAKATINTANWWDDFRPEGILAKMLDWFDGRNTYTRVLTEWMAHDDYRVTPIMPPYATLELNMRWSYQIWMKKFATMPVSPFRDFMLGFIHDEMYLFHRLRWDPVIEKTSPEVQEMYREFIESGVNV